MGVRVPLLALPEMIWIWDRRRGPWWRLAPLCADHAGALRLIYLCGARPSSIVAKCFREHRRDKRVFARRARSGRRSMPPGEASQCAEWGVSQTRLRCELGPLSNWRLVAVVLPSILVQLALPHLDFAQRLFEIGHVPALDNLLALGLGLIPVSVLELR